PRDAGVGERTADGDRAHVDPRAIPEAPERMEPHTYDRDVHGLSSYRAFIGRNANVTTSLPSPSVRHGTRTISMPIPSVSPAVVVRRVSTFTWSSSST